MRTAPVEAFTTQGRIVLLSAEEVARASFVLFGTTDAFTEALKAIVVIESTVI